MQICGQPVLLIRVDYSDTPCTIITLLILFSRSCSIITLLVLFARLLYYYHASCTILTLLELFSRFLYYSHASCTILTLLVLFSRFLYYSHASCPILTLLVLLCVTNWCFHSSSYTVIGHASLKIRVAESTCHIYIPTPWLKSRESIVGVWWGGGAGWSEASSLWFLIWLDRCAWRTKRCIGRHGWPTRINFARRCLADNAIIFHHIMLSSPCLNAPSLPHSAPFLDRVYPTAVTYK